MNAPGFRNDLRVDIFACEDHIEDIHTLMRLLNENEQDNPIIREQDAHSITVETEKLER